MIYLRVKYIDEVIELVLERRSHLIIMASIFENEKQISGYEVYQEGCKTSTQGWGFGNLPKWKYETGLFD